MEITEVCSQLETSLFTTFTPDCQAAWMLQCLTECQLGVVLSCLTLFSLDCQLEQSFNPLLKAIIYSASWATKRVNCRVSNKGAQGTEHGVERIHTHYNNQSH